MDFSRTPPANVVERRPNAVPLDALLALSNDGFLFVRSDALVASWSDAAASLSGIPDQVALGADVRRLFVQGDKIVGVPFDGNLHELRVGVENKAGIQWLRLIAVGVDVDTHAHGWLCSFGPERRYREIEQLKSEIVTAVSHELKTPIATIKAYATTLRENPRAVEGQRDDFLRVIDEQTDRLTRVVDELLLASRVDAEQLLKRRITIPLEEVVDAALMGLAFDDATHPIELRAGNAVLSGDPEKLRDVMLHLIDNAAKFSKAGSPITIEGETNEDETVVRVSDLGIGISDEHLPYIFERFYRAEPELTAQTSGSGLGLAIVSALVRAHGGRIAVSSELGRGSTFTIHFPVRSGT
ncbi:MAG TPA: HAMP domain-containing sensor histidine kinase [Candidatus Baltobacteraceae bacterium]|nr:HAMP domain-containing sensor histidine kinase [Candidatus Baltobacteraceae bacterium]